MLDAIKLREQAAREIKPLTRPDDMTHLHLDPLSALVLIGTLQVALRHPKLPGSAESQARSMLVALRTPFERNGCAACLEIIRLGDPGQEVEGA